MNKSINALTIILLMSLFLNSCKKEALEKETSEEIKSKDIDKTNLQDSLKIFESIDNDPTISKVNEQYKSSIDFRRKFNKDFNINAKRPQISRINNSLKAH